MCLAIQVMVLQVTDITTWCHNLEDCGLSCHRKNLRSHVCLWSV